MRTGAHTPVVQRRSIKAATPESNFATRDVAFVTYHINRPPQHIHTHIHTPPYGAERGGPGGKRGGREGTESDISAFGYQ